MPRPIATTRGLHLAEPRAASAFDPIDERVLPFNRRIFIAEKSSIAAATTDAFGAGGAAALGGAGVNTNEVEGNYNTYTTGAVAGNRNGVSVGGEATPTISQPRWNPTVFWDIKTAADITSQRIFVHLNTGTFAVSTDTPQANTVGFRYSTVVPDTNWQAYSRDGATTNLIDTGVAVVADTRYAFMITLASASARFYINEALVATSTTNLPADTTSFSAQVVIFTTAAATRAIKWQMTAGVSD